jgi:hypothetical protein
MVMCRHCEERSDEAIQLSCVRSLIASLSLAMTPLSHPAIAFDRPPLMESRRRTSGMLFP